jgi:hypothetical protein
VRSAGIYYAAEWDTSEQYATPGRRGTAVMLVARVALGKAQKQILQDGSIERPAPGFQSVHGDPTAKGTMFDDHEYAVYTQTQHTMSYLVEFKPSKLAGTAL